jgi:hypothetical protein
MQPPPAESTHTGPCSPSICNLARLCDITIAHDMQLHRAAATIYLATWGEGTHIGDGVHGSPRAQQLHHHFLVPIHSCPVQRGLPILWQQQCNKV